MKKLKIATIFPAQTEFRKSSEEDKKIMGNKAVGKLYSFQMIKIPDNGSLPKMTGRWIRWGY